MNGSCEIIPQADFSSNSLRMASLLAPVLQFYKILLFPLAEPSVLCLISGLKGIEHDGHVPIEKDPVFIWGENEKRVITGADILGRLL